MKAFKKTGYLLMKENLTKTDAKELTTMEDMCKRDKINLKLELDYKISLLEAGDYESTISSVMKEYFYYVDNKPVSYLGISSFGGSVYELNGMTHPDFRRKGLFRKLYDHAVLECKSAGKNKLLLLTDGSSPSGIGFIEAVGGVYSFSESRMELTSVDYYSNPAKNRELLKKVSLRKASDEDVNLIQEYDKVLYSREEGNEEGDITCAENTYMIEENSVGLGKIRIDHTDKEAFIYGFGILPEYRGQGYGKAALLEALRIIFESGCKRASLDVETKNDRALTIYTGNGFQPVSVMKYYEITL